MLAWFTRRSIDKANGYKGVSWIPVLTTLQSV
jgi:hypothetical protein